MLGAKQRWVVLGVFQCWVVLGVFQCWVVWAVQTVHPEPGQVLHGCEGPEHGVGPGPRCVSAVHGAPGASAEHGALHRPRIFEVVLGVDEV